MVSSSNLAATVNSAQKRAIVVGSQMISRLEGEWEENEEEDFKTLFLIAALNMVVCPTQAISFPCDLIPAATCTSDSDQYDWAGLLLEKLMDSVKAFGKRFYYDAFAGGCGGCSIFLAVFYLDRLNRNPVRWGVGPRIRVWTTEEMKKACRQDRIPHNGDFGKLGCVDVAYGEPHPREARDTAAGDWLWTNEVADELPNSRQRSRTRRKSLASNYIVERKRRKVLRENSEGQLSRTTGSEHQILTEPAVET